MADRAVEEGRPAECCLRPAVRAAADGGAEGQGGALLHAVEREAQVSRRTVERTLKGEVLPDFGAIARLEEWLGTDLWPGPELRSASERS